MSINMVRRLYPAYDDATVLALARVQFETAAVNFFVSTLQVRCRRYVAEVCATASHAAALPLPPPPRAVGLLRLPRQLLLPLHQHLFSQPAVRVRPHP